MLEPFYYPLAEAAKRMGVSEAVLIQHGRFRQIRIVIPKPVSPCFIIETTNYEKMEIETEYVDEEWLEFLYFTFYQYENDINFGTDSPGGPTLPVHPNSLSEFESGFLERHLVLYAHRLKDGRISEQVKIRNPCTGQPITLGEAKLSVLYDDLEQFRKTLSGEGHAKPWLIPNPNDPPAQYDWWTAARYFARKHKGENPHYGIDELWPLVQADFKEAGIYKRGNKEPHGEAAIKKALGNIPDLKKSIKLS